MDFGARGKRVKGNKANHMIWPIDEDLLIKVLCCLPPKILIRCCCVCKGWYKLIDRYCVPQITPSLPLLGCYMRIKTSSENPVVVPSSIPQVEADVDTWPSVFNTNNPIAGPDLLKDFFHGPKHLLDSCNGLMLFMHPWELSYVLWNPNTKQFLIIPSPGTTEQPVDFAVLAVEPTWILDRKRNFFKIIAYPKNRDVMTVLYSSRCCWKERKVKYNSPIDNDTSIQGKKFVYLHGRMFTLCQHCLLWYTIEDDYADVICDHVKLPSGGDHSGSRSGRKRGCIGSCWGRLQLAQNEGVGLVEIWVFSIDTREWIFLHCVSLEAAVRCPQPGDSSTMFPAVKAKFKVLAFDPRSDDGVIIWTPNLIFCYYYKSGNSVSLQCPKRLKGALKHPPHDAFPLTPCLTPLLFRGGRGQYIINVAKQSDGSSASWIEHTDKKRLEVVLSNLRSMLLG